MSLNIAVGCADHVTRCVVSCVSCEQQDVVLRWTRVFRGLLSVVSKGLEAGCGFYCACSSALVGAGMHSQLSVYIRLAAHTVSRSMPLAFTQSLCGPHWDQ